MFVGWSCLVLCGYAAEVNSIDVGDVTFSYSNVTGIGLEPGFCRRDPSDVIKVGDTFYVWYTKVPQKAHLYPSGYNGDVWYATSTDEGQSWEEKGLAVPRGEDGAFDAFSTFTPNIVVWQRKYYLYYTAVANGFKNTGYVEIGKTKIGVAVADSPDGPWTKPASNIMIEPSPDHARFDSYRTDDSCVVIRDGKVWLYYKGRQWNGTPRETHMGVAVADNPLGPFKKQNDGKFIQDSGHEVMVWPYKQGIMSLASNVGPNGRSLFYAADGISFKVVKPGLRNLPIAPGSYRADLSGEPAYDDGITWGIAMVLGHHPYLRRYEINIQ